MQKMFSLQSVKGSLFVVSILVFGLMFSIAGVVSADNPVPGGGLADGGFGTGYTTVNDNSGLSSSSISSIIQVFMRWLLYIVAFLAVIAFVISGVMYLTSAGDDDRIDKAKTTMIYAIIGVIVALLGLIILNAVKTLLGTTTAEF